MGLRALSVLVVSGFLFLMCADAGAEGSTAPVLFKSLEGNASWYRGSIVAGNKPFVNGRYAAMWGVPLGTKVRVTDIHNGKSVIVTINDRGPNKRLVAKGRIIDLTAKMFYKLNGNMKASTIRVRREILRKVNGRHRRHKPGRLSK